MAQKPPVWIRNILDKKGPWYGPIDRWLRTFTIDEPVLEPLGGGHFGFAYRVRKGSRGGMRLMRGEEDPTGLVFKITRDPTEGPFCRWIHEEQEKGNSMFQGAFARMYDVKQLPDKIQWRGKEWPVYLIIREEVNIYNPRANQYRQAPGAEHPGVPASEALRVLQVAGRQLAKPRKRGRATVTKAAHRGGVYLGHVTIDAEKAWEDALHELEIRDGWYYVWEAFWQMRSEYGIYMQDVHSGNVGKRITMPGEDWSGAEGYWVIFDPGHTPTGDHAGQIEVLRVANPPATVTYEDIHYEGHPWAITRAGRPVVGELGDVHSGSAFTKRLVDASGVSAADLKFYDKAVLLSGRWHPASRTLAFWQPKNEDLFWKHVDRLKRPLGIESLDDVQIAVLGGDPSSESPIRYMNGGGIVPVLEMAAVLENPGMTRSEALAEARKRWGPDAHVQEPGESASDTYEVGIIVDGDYIAEEPDSFWDKGRGRSWEAAFADADRRGR